MAQRQMTKKEFDLLPPKMKKYYQMLFPKFKKSRLLMNNKKGKK